MFGFQKKKLSIYHSDCEEGCHKHPRRMYAASEEEAKRYIENYSFCRPRCFLSCVFNGKIYTVQNGHLWTIADLSLIYIKN